MAPKSCTHTQKKRNTCDLRDWHTLAIRSQQFEINETMILYCLLHSEYRMLATYYAH